MKIVQRVPSILKTLFGQRNVTTATGVIMTLSIAFCGCSKPNSTAEIEDESGTPISANQEAGQRIVGQWLGKAEVDKERVREVIAATTDPSEKENILNMVESFESVTIGARFDRDNSMQLEVEFALEGAPSQRESSVGTWKLIEENEFFMVVETIENHNAEHPDVRRIRYDFLRDNDHIAMEAPTNKALRQFSPRFVFERRDPDEEASNPSTWR